MGWPQRLGIVVLIVAAVYGLWLMLEPIFLEHTCREVRPLPAVDDLSRPVKAQPVAWEPEDAPARATAEGDSAAERSDANQASAARLRVHFFSDYHAGLRRVPLRRITRALTETPADLVIFGGDLSSSARDRAKGLREIRDLSEQVRLAHGRPIVGVMGNHDLGLQEEDAARHGLYLLQNTCLIVEDARGYDWLIAGEEDMRIGRPSPETALRRMSPYQSEVAPRSDGHAEGSEPSSAAWIGRAAKIPPERRIIIGHNPDQVMLQTRDDAAFFLSGHFHGGQIRLPFGLEFSLLRKERLLRLGIHQGFFRYRGVLGYISRGIGCVLFPFRFLARPELTSFTFYDRPMDAGPDEA